MGWWWERSIESRLSSRYGGSRTSRAGDAGGGSEERERARGGQDQGLCRPFAGSRGVSLDASSMPPESSG